MTTIADAADALARVAPLELAEEWDNVGLLAGDPSAPLQRAMTCLTLTPDVAQEAIDRRVQLVVAHHPLPFRPVSKLTVAAAAGETTGDTLWRLAGAGVAVYSAHTAYDSCVGGVNDQLAQVFALTDAEPLSSSKIVAGGVGRIGRAAADATRQTLTRIAGHDLRAVSLRCVGDPGQPAGRVAIACGSGGSLLDLAIGAGCDTFLTGEMSFHDCLKARAAGVGVLLLGHFASEHFAVRRLAEQLATASPGVECFASSVETDPLQPAV
ncbi:MAG: Nif3-like dinuclear metal center hexameric protein [Planctomycetota bacterium]